VSNPCPRAILRASWNENRRLDLDLVVVLLACFVSVSVLIVVEGDEVLGVMEVDVMSSLLPSVPIQEDKELLLHTTRLLGRVVADIVVMGENEMG
jgi:hypothetical protein